MSMINSTSVRILSRLLKLSSVAEESFPIRNLDRIIRWSSPEGRTSPTSSNRAATDRKMAIVILRFFFLKIQLSKYISSKRPWKCFKHVLGGYKLATKDVLLNFIHIFQGNLTYRIRWFWPAEFSRSKILRIFPHIFFSIFLKFSQVKVGL